MRKALDHLYNAAGYLAAFFMVGVLLMVLASVAGRLLGFNLRGSDAYAGYAMAAASFLALAHTLRCGEHIRVTLFMDRFEGRLRRPLDLWSHAAGAFFCGALAWFSVRLVFVSREFNDISQGNDATPLWIPQIAMAVGSVILLVAVVDGFVALVRGGDRAAAGGGEARRME